MRFLRVWDPEHAVKDPTWLGRGSAPPPGIAGPKVKSRTWTAPDQPPSQQGSSAARDDGALSWLPSASQGTRSLCWRKTLNQRRDPGQ